MSDYALGKKTKRSWLSFSIRGLMFFTLVVSCLLGWIGRDLYRARAEESLVYDIQLNGGRTRYDYVYEVPPPAHLCLVQIELKQREPNGHWLARKILGKNIYSYITIADLGWADDANLVLPRIATFSRLEELSIANIALTDASIEAISRLRKLKSITLDDVQITPDQMQRIAAIDSLDTLYLTGNSATDAVIERVARFKNLRDLSLRSTTLSDHALVSLARAQSLEQIRIDDSKQITNDGLVALLDLPKLESLSASGTSITNLCARTLAKMPVLRYARISADDPDVDFGDWRSYDLSPLDGCDRSISIMEDTIWLNTFVNNYQPPPSRPLPTLKEPLPPAFADVYNDPFIPFDAEAKTTKSLEMKDPFQ